MSNRNVHVILDRELFAGVSEHAEKLFNGAKANMSAAIRDLLRQSLHIVSSGYDAGWREGYSAAYSEAQGRLTQTFSEMSPIGEQPKKSK